MKVIEYMEMIKDGFLDLEITSGDEDSVYMLGFVLRETDRLSRKMMDTLIAKDKYDFHFGENISELRDATDGRR